MSIPVNDIPSPHGTIRLRVRRTTRFSLVMKMPHYFFFFSLTLQSGLKETPSHSEKLLHDPLDCFHMFDCSVHINSSLWWHWTFIWVNSTSPSYKGASKRPRKRTRGLGVGPVLGEHVVQAWQISGKLWLASLSTSDTANRWWQTYLLRQGLKTCFVGTHYRVPGVDTWD